MRSSSLLSFITVLAAHYSVVNTAAIASPEIDNNETSALAARDDGFKYSCDDIGFVAQFRSLLFATCRKADGTIGGNTQINLDKCVGNDNGQLVAQAKLVPVSLPFTFDVVHGRWIVSIEIQANKWSLPTVAACGGLATSNLAPYGTPFSSATVASMAANGRAPSSILVSSTLSHITCFITPLTQRS